jgi:bifunctional UDP-N-acetylglucosamine pyrophosphorylase/glucosamine-1-phosphate N-acetyltransferase
VPGLAGKPAIAHSQIDSRRFNNRHMPATLEIVILAAGKGTRMRSELPKVLHEVGGAPLLKHVIDCAQALGASATHVVYGHGGERVRERLADTPVNWVLQADQRGTGHALQQAIPAVANDARVLVLYGDVPLISPATLRQLLDAAAAGVGLLTAELPDGAGYGRIMRDTAGRVVRIVERKDATAAELAVREINTGFLTAPAQRLKHWLSQLRNDNAQGEYYLTDVIALAVADGVPIATRQPQHLWEILGVNSKQELAQLERIYQHRRAEELMSQGVTLRDPARIDVRGSLSCGRDVVIDVNCVFEGKVELADGVTIGPNNWLRDVRIGARSQVLPNCVLEESAVGADCRIGPFARIRPGTVVADSAHVGNFVEIKKSEIGSGSKVNHLSYVGDATVGAQVNIGAGTITCNYDGANKHRTVIGNQAFIGSNTALVAPVTIGAGATVGAGSVITKDAPAGELTLTRAEQKTRPGWKRPVKKKQD